VIAAASSPLRPEQPPSVDPAFSPAPGARLGRRLAAVLYENLLLTALVLITGFALLPVNALPVPRRLTHAISFAVLVLVLGAYCVHFWTNGRRTLAMKTWRLRLLRRDGAPLDRGAAIVRYAAGWIGPLLTIGAYSALSAGSHARQALWLLAFNFAWAFIDPQRLFLHDRIAGTRLVEDEPRS
jgi:uncharacterized RDD family membrane protein YckC